MCDHWQLITARASVVSLLLHAGALVEHRDSINIHGETPPTWACKGFFAPIVCILVEAGADVGRRVEILGWLTPLHWVCRFSDVGNLEALLNAG